MGRPREITDEQIVNAARRCFFARGAGVSAVDIARELGVSHTTLFNRFGSKEGLMVAALGAPATVPWADALRDGPDDRPVRDQLVEHARVMAAFFQELEAGVAILRAAGIDAGRSCSATSGESGPQQAYHALVAWLERAREQRRLADCDIETLASTILGSLHGWALTSHVCGASASADAGALYVERFVGLLWEGIGPPAH